MTTVAYDGKELATDSRESSEGSYYTDQCKKLYKVGSRVIGFCGNLEEGHKFIKWAGNRTKPKPEGLTDEFGALEVSLRTGEVFYYESGCIPIKVKPPVSIGSGDVAAQAAMLCGKSASEAVRVAIKLDLYSGGRVQKARVTKK